MHIHMHKHTSISLYLLFVSYASMVSSNERKMIFLFKTLQFHPMCWHLSINFSTQEMDAGGLQIWSHIGSKKFSFKFVFFLFLFLFWYSDSSYSFSLTITLLCTHSFLSCEMKALAAHCTARTCITSAGIFSSIFHWHWFPSLLE